MPRKRQKRKTPSKKSDKESSVVKAEELEDQSDQLPEPEPKKQKGSARQNVGGGSTLKWFNLLLDREDLKFILTDLYKQLSEHSTVDMNSVDPESPCILFHKDTNRPKKGKGTPPASPLSKSEPITSFFPSSKEEVINVDDEGEKPQPSTPQDTPPGTPTGTDASERVLEHPRIEPRLPTKKQLKEMHPLFEAVLPRKINASHVALLMDGRRRPDKLPPQCPPDWFKSLFGRLATDAEAKWVASHLCHQKECVQPEHIIWEPGWYNRARDNCPGKVVCTTCHTEPAASCGHFPQCIRAHRAPALNWNTLAEGGPFTDESPTDIEQLFGVSSSSGNVSESPSHQTDLGSFFKKAARGSNDDDDFV